MVIRIGLMRRRTDSRTASSRGVPFLRAVRMKSRRRMLLFTIVPARRISPIVAGLHMGLSKRRRAHMAPATARGIAAMMVIGLPKERNMARSSM